MNTHQNEGREIAHVFWPRNNHGESPSVTSSEHTQLRFHSEYLGDHSENWVIELRGGREMRRHNTRFIETIVWIED